MYIIHSYSAININFGLMHVCTCYVVLYKIFKPGARCWLVPGFLSHFHAGMVHGVHVYISKAINKYWHNLNFA